MLCLFAAHKRIGIRVRVYGIHDWCFSLTVVGVSDAFNFQHVK